MEQISNEEIIKKRAQCPIVLVSDDNKTWIERILIDTNIDDSCNIVLALYKESFLLGEGYLSCTFKFWKPLPQIVPFEHGREIDFDWLFKNKDGDIFTVEHIGKAVVFIKNIYIKYKFNFNFKTIYDNFEMSKDGGETWGKAGKETTC